MSMEQALIEAEAFIRRAVARTANGNVRESDIKAAAERIVKALPPIDAP